MKKVLFLFVFLSIVPLGIRSQNLVPNHNFSRKKGCPISSPEINSHLFNWFNAPLQVGDSIYGKAYNPYLYDTCQLGFSKFGFDSIYLPGTNCLSNYYYYPYPKEAWEYIWISVIDTFYDNRTWYRQSNCTGPWQLRQNPFAVDLGRSFIEVEISKPLIASNEYIIEFYTVRSSEGNNFYSSNIAALVTQDTFRHFDYKKNNLTPTVEASMPIFENRNWVRVKGSFIANGNERFLTLGNFRKDKNSNFIKLPADTNRGGGIGPQYYFDAVYLYLHTDTLFNVELPPDTTLCPGQALRLHAWHDDGFKLEDTVKTFLWSTGSTDSSITITQPGFYWVKVEYNHRFWQSDTIEVKRAVPPYSSGLKPLREGCQGDEIILKAQSDPNRQLLWSTGYVGQSITVRDSGYYWLSALSVCDTVIDSVLVNLIDCDTVKALPPVYIPNAFTPNGDGLNDTWAIGNLPKENELVLFNRWGELIYRKVNYANEWDGTNRDGSMLPLGIYIYQLTYIHNNGKKVIDQGWLSVLDN